MLFCVFQPSDMSFEPKSVIRPTSLGQCLQKVVYYCLFCFFLASFCFLLGHYARITPSFKDKNPLKNKAKNPNNSNDRFGLKCAILKLHHSAERVCLASSMRRPSQSGGYSSFRTGFIGNHPRSTLPFC